MRLHHLLFALVCAAFFGRILWLKAPTTCPEQKDVRSTDRPASKVECNLAIQS